MSHEQGDLFADDAEHKPIEKPAKVPRAAKPKPTAKADVELPVAQPIGAKRNIYVGTCSWSDPSLIKCKRFYPPGFGSAERRLAYYASRFPVVEVDSSYFAMPQAAKSALWVQRTPANFVFNIKAFRIFTGHQTPDVALPPDIRALLPPPTGRGRNYYYRDLPEEFRHELWRRFIEAIAPLKEASKLRAVHFQFAPWVANNAESRQLVEECVERMKGHLLAVEFRNQTWLNPERVQDTLAWERELGVAHVIVDEPQGVGNFAHGVWAVTNPALAVVRLHGRNETTWNAKGLTAASERFDYEYESDDLREIASRMLELLDEAFELQALLNVNFEDQGIRAANKLIDHVVQLDSQDRETLGADSDPDPAVDPPGGQGGNENDR
jgi:uncharacterized protein YecE (DUF72 family)